MARSRSALRRKSSSRSRRDLLVRERRREFEGVHRGRTVPPAGRECADRAVSPERRPATRAAAGPGGASGRTGLRPGLRWRSIHSRSPHGGSTRRRVGQQLGQRLRGGPRVVGVALPAAEDQRRDVERPGLGVGQPGDVLVVAGAVGQHPALHRRDELGPVLRQEPLPVGRVQLLHLGPLRQVRHRLHAVLPRRAHGPAAVVRGQRQQAVDPAADPPDGQAGRRLGMAGRGRAATRGRRPIRRR